MKRLLIFGMMTAIVSLGIFACKDDFNEQDFLKLQSDLKLKQDSISRARDFAAVDQTSKQAVEEYIAAVNEAGDLMAVTLMVRENGVPVPGVSVSLTTGTANSISSGRTKAVQTASTDNSGNVVFENVVIGSGTISFSKTGYVGATATVDFGQPAAPQQITTTVNGTTITKYIPPVKRFEEAVVQMFSTANTGSTATITGRVIIENDVTNTTPEVPSGVVIRANLANLVSGNNEFITGYTLADNSALGVATVAANGTYTMTVPALAAGLNIPLIIPNIEGTCRMAVNGYDDGTGTAVALPSPEYRDVPSTWGPQAPDGFGITVPNVAGARLVFPAAPAVGSGLSFDFAPVGKPIGTGTISASQTASVGGAFYRISNRGNYSNGPAPTVSIGNGGGSGSGATARATMQTYVSSLTVTDVGSGYAGYIRVNITRERNTGGDVNEGYIDVAAVGDKLPATIDLTTFVGAYGFHPETKKVMGSSDLKALKITLTAPPGSVLGTGGQVTAVFKTEVASVQILTGGDGYTSVPTFSFTGAGLPDGSADHATIDVVNFPRFWTITPNNANTSDYAVMPTFSVTYPPSPAGTIAAEANVDVFTSSGSQESNNVSLAGLLTIAGGDVVKRNSNVQLRTNTESGAQPTIVVTPVLPVNAERTLTGAHISASNGSISSFPGGLDNGDGYSSPVTVTVLPAITGAPGSGAVISLTNTFDVNTLEYTWTGSVTFLNRGSGYLRNLNRKLQDSGTLPSSDVNVQPGKTYTVNIDYGTGRRRVNVN